MNICALIILLIDLAVLHQLLPSHCSLHCFCSRDPDTIPGTYKWNWEPGHSKASSYRSVRIVYSFLLTFQFNQPLCAYTRAALFSSFPCAMLYMHVGMILTGMTTVEKMDMSSMEFRESMLLAKFYSWWEFGWAFFNFNFPSFCWHSIPQWLTVPRRRNGESGTRNGVPYRRKEISGGRGIDTQSGWMLWAIRGWDGFVSDHFMLIFLFFFLRFFSWYYDLFVSW